MPLKDGIVDGYGWTGYEVKRRKAAFGKEYEWTKQRAWGSSTRLGKACKGWDGKAGAGSGTRVQTKWQNSMDDEVGEVAEALVKTVVKKKGVGASCTSTSTSTSRCNYYFISIKISLCPLNLFYLHQYFFFDGWLFGLIMAVRKLADK